MYGQRLCFRASKGLVRAGLQPYNYFRRRWDSKRSDKLNSGNAFLSAQRQAAGNPFTRKKILQGAWVTVENSQARPLAE